MTGASNTARLTWFTHIESDVCTGRAGRALCRTLRESRRSRPIFLCSVSSESSQSLMPSSLDRPRLLSLAPCPNAHTALTDARPFFLAKCSVDLRAQLDREMLAVENHPVDALDTADHGLGRRAEVACSHSRTWARLGRCGSITPRSPCQSQLPVVVEP